MKTYNDDLKKKDIEVYGVFKSWWKTNDPDWLANRQAVWRSVKGEAENPHMSFLEEFYVTGEEPPAYIVHDGRADERIAFEFYQRAAFMPYETREQVLEFWQAVLKRYDTDIKGRHTDFLFVGSVLDGFPERDEIVKLVTETIFSPEYFMCAADSKFAPEGTLATILPRDFVVEYSGLSPFYHKNNKNNWDYRNFSFEYFLLSIRNCEESSSLKPHYESELPNMYKYLLKLDDSGLSQYRAELKQMLIAAAEDQDAPALLKDALKEARS